MVGFPISSQVLSGIIFTCVSSSRTQSMSNSPILSSTFSFSSKISDNQVSLCSFRVSCICINTFSNSCLCSAIYVSILGFPSFKFILSILAIILGKSNTSWSIALQKRQLGLLPVHSLDRWPGFLQL